MQKITEFIEKYKLWFAVGFLALLIIYCFVPTTALIIINNESGVTEFFISSSFNFHTVFSRTDICFDIMAFAIIQVLIFISIVVFFITYFIKSDKAQKVAGYSFSAMSILQILDFIFFMIALIIDIIDFQDFNSSYYSHKIILHIGFYVYLVLTAFSIVYFVTIIKRLQYHFAENKRQNKQKQKPLTKQQQIDELKQQVKELQDQINKNN